MQDNNNNKTIDTDETDLREVYEKFRYNYKWFILGTLLAVLAAYLYLRYTPNQYEVNASILIDDKDNGGNINSELSTFADLGLLGDSKTSLDTEIDVLKSRTLMQRVVKDLGINVTYLLDGRVRLYEQYKKSIPFKINFLTKDSLFYASDKAFTIAALSDTQFILENKENDQIIEGVFGEKIESDLGDMIITPSNIGKVELGNELLVKISHVKAIANDYLRRVKIAAKSKKSSVLVLSLKDPIKQKAQDILNNLITQYNKDAVDDKLQIAKNTDDFINNRIKDISTELTSVDLGVETYKTENKLTDIEYEAGLVLKSGSELQRRIIDLTGQIKLIDYVSKYMKTNKDDLIPENLGLKDEMTSQSTANFNKLLLEKNRILMGSSKMNPTVINLEAQIVTLRASIDRSLVNLRKSLAISLNEAKLQEQRLDSKIAKSPKQEREFQDIKRRQQIIETLYLYLLQKREENAITLAVTAPIAKLIDAADGSEIPVSPKRKLIYIIAALLGFIITFIIISIRFFLDNNIHTVEDVESVVKAPVLGDIPSAGSEKKIVISQKDTSNVAESFRLLRTNVNFMLPGVKEASKTIFVTSTVENEGKTFVAINLASALTLLNKKVLMIEGDVRKPEIASYLDMELKEGLTHYLTDTDLKVEDVISHDEATNLDIIQSGAIPSNPSELLTNGRFDEVLAYGKEHYDYILVDTAPVNRVTDTLLFGHFADMFIYVIRANYTDKRMLKIPQKMYENNRLPNMAILLNDTDYEKKGYGYGYVYSEKEIKKPWWKGK